VSTGELADIPKSCIASNIVRERPTGTYVRSAQLTQPMQSLSGRQPKQLEQELGKLGFKKSEVFTVPTRVVCEMFDKLRADAVTMMNLEKHVQKRQAEVSVKMGLHFVFIFCCVVCRFGCSPIIIICSFCCTLSSASPFFFFLLTLFTA
jgi:hypothetical protein